MKRIVLFSIGCQAKVSEERDDKWMVGFTWIVGLSPTMTFLGMARGQAIALTELFVEELFVF